MKKLFIILLMLSVFGAFLFIAQAGPPASAPQPGGMTTSQIDTAAELESVANLGAYFSDFAAATSEANFKSITNLEAGTDYYSITSLNSLAELEALMGGGAYMSDILAATSEANLKSIVNLEANTDFYAPAGTDVPVTDGGTGLSTITDGGIMLGSGTGAVTPMAVLADGQFVVGDGTTDPVAESGATARTSMGVEWITQEVTTDADPDTLTPSDGINVLMLLTAHQAAVSIAFAETNATHEDTVRVCNVASDTIDFADEAAVFETSTPIDLAQDECFTMVYRTDRYVVISRDTKAASFASFTLPNSDDPDVTAAGMISMDTDGWMRIYQNSLQKGLPVDENISMTILQPDDADEGDTMPIWCNFSGMNFEIHTIYAMADADDADFDLETAPYTDFTDLTEIESITVSTNSTGVFTYTIGAGAGTDIDEGTIPTGECIIYEPTADDLEFVTVTILGYYVGDVD